MLDIGFIHAIRRMMGHVPAKRQSLFFSATLPKDIAALAAELLQGPGQGQRRAGGHDGRAGRAAGGPCRPSRQEGRAGQAPGRACGDPGIVFTRTKHRADQVTRHLQAAGIGAAAIHGNKSQNNRERALGGFKDGTHQGAGGDRHRRARHRRRRGQPRGQFRPAGRARDLRPPHRPHRPRRRRRAWRSPSARPTRAATGAPSRRLIRQRVPVMEVEGSRATGADRAAHQRAEAYEPAPRNGRGGAAPSGRDGSGQRRYQGAAPPAGGRPAASRSAPGAARMPARKAAAAHGRPSAKRCPTLTIEPGP